MDTAIIIFLLLPNTPLFSAGPAKYRLNADALMRGRPLSLTIYYHALRDFNPRPLVGTTSCTDRLSRHGWNFNPRPRMGATLADFVDSPGHVIFNPRPRMGATGHLCKRAFSDFISIHAPIRGRLSDETAR